MRTELLIPFEIDTSAVERRLENDVYDEAVKKLTDQFMSSLPKRYGSIDWNQAGWQVIERFLETHADEIIDMATELLARKAGNRKRWREALDEMRNERKEEGNGYDPSQP